MMQIQKKPGFTIVSTLLARLRRAELPDIINQPQRGFSIIELLIVLVFLSAAIAIFVRFTDTFNRIGKARNQIKSYHLAAKKMEELRSVPFASLSTSGSFTENDSTGQLTVTDYQSSSEIKQVTVEVFYYDHSIQRKVQLDTLISKYGLNPKN